MIVWSDPMTELRSNALYELTTRLLAETDPKKLDALIQQRARIVEGKIRHDSQN